ncbi:hypothetical protein J4E91_009689 [Alternaria rosae]|nr:hypothetical protein J4E91_009689 [Alternaria rosae]
MVLFFAVVAISLIFVFIELWFRADVSQFGSAFASFRDKPNNKTPENPNADPTWKDRVRAAGRTFVLGVADTQTIFVGAFLLGFAGRSKFAVSQMMIALSVITFSIALVRTYWRNPLAAAFRLLLSVGAFIGVGLTIFREANYAPYGALTHSNNDSAILLPVACMLEMDLRSAAEEQARQNQAELSFGNATAWPPERFMYIVLGAAFIAAHISVPIRFAESKDRAPKVWTEKRAFVTLIYWILVLLTPIVTSTFCWFRVYTMREWVADSGWMEDPNTEMIVWDSGQLIAMGVLITVIMNVLTEAKEREKKNAKKNDHTDGEAGVELLPTAYRGYEY